MLTTPYAGDDLCDTDAGQAVQCHILMNDYAMESGAFIDPASVAVQTSPENGTIDIDPSIGIATYTPNAGFSGSDSFTYKVSDTSGNESGEATVNLNINAPSAPIAADDSGWMDYGQPATIYIAMNDYATQSGAFIDPASVAIQTGPLNGTVNIDTSMGMVTYTPNTGFSGSDSFTYRVSDTNGTESGEATVNLNINAPVAPVAADDSGWTDYGQPATVYIAMNDYATGSGAFIDPATIAIITPPVNGTFSIDPCMGQATYTPNSGFSGVDSFTYTVNDTNGTVSNEATVTINIAAPTAPVAVNDSGSTEEGQMAVIAILGNDYVTMSQVSLDPSSVSIVSGPSNGTVSVDSSTGEVNYLPFIGFTGDDTFSYTVSDGNGIQSNVATVMLSVSAMSNAAPTIDWFTASDEGNGIWRFEGQVTDESPYNVTVALGGILDVVVSVDTDGSFVYYAMLSPGTNGNATAEATDELGLVSDLAVVEVQT